MNDRNGINLRVISYFDRRIMESVQAEERKRPAKSEKADVVDTKPKRKPKKLPWNYQNVGRSFEKLPPRFADPD